jgi:hypothetical protein
MMSYTRQVAVAAVVLAAVLLVSTTQVSAVNVNLRRMMSARPVTSFERFARSGIVPGDKDPLSQVRSTLRDADDSDDDDDSSDDDDSDMSLVQTGMKKVRSYCEICILVMQMKQRGQPHLCAGLNANHYVTCIETLESLMRADKAVVYWLKNGCMHMDSTGPEIVRPCPALSICSWVPNLFAQPPAVVRDGVESLCPKDPKFLPSIPNEYKALLQPQQQNAAAPAPTGGQ